MAEPYPVNYDKLTKGHLIDAAECERIVGKPRSHPRYSFELLKLRARIMSDMKQRNTPVTVRTVAGGLEVLTDAAASEYNAKQGRQGLRRHMRTHRRNLDVNTANLTADELRAHERRLLRSARIAQAISSVRAQLKVEGRKRVTPAISAQ